MPLGATAAIGEGWELRVDAYVADATAVVVATDDSNEPPPSGYVYALAALTVAYNGPDEVGSFFDVDVGALTSAGEFADMFSCDAFPPDELDTGLDVAPGEPISGNVCFELPAGTAALVVMYGVAGPNADVYFALS